MSAVEARDIRGSGRALRSLGWGVAALLGILLALYAVAALSLPSARQPLIVDLMRSAPWPLILHLSGGAVAVAIGTLQLSRRIRVRYPAVHRWLGRFYVAGVLIGGGAGVLLAPRSGGGLVAHWGFGLLGVLWIASTITAYIHIRNRRVEQHRAWMLRSYALTFAAVTLRFWIPLSQIAGVSFVVAYPAIAWLCWVPNLAVAEWVIRRRPWKP